MGGGVSSLDAAWQRQEWTATGGQTVFTLNRTPNQPLSVEVTRNGVEQHEGTDFSLSGLTVTWIGPALDAGEQIIIRYL